MDLIKDYDLVIDYHSEKVNLVTNTLSRKSSVTLTHICTTYVPLLLNLKTLRVNLDCDYNGALLTNFVVRSTLIDQIRSKQMQDDELVKKV